MEFSEHLEQINQNFKLAQIGLQIEVRGQKLYLRGVLPPKNELKLRPYQQRLNLRVTADEPGLKRAEQIAKLLYAQILQDTFCWQHFSVPIADNSGDNSVKNFLLADMSRFEEYFWKTRGGKASAQTTWKTAYLPYLSKLRAAAESNPSSNTGELIYQTILSTTPDTRSRQVCCTALKSFADFLGIMLPFTPQNFSGNYGYKHLKTRDLPDDETILKSYNLIPNPQWRFVFGIMATFGLRNHEVFFCDYSRLALANQNQQATIMVQESSKTGSHEVWAFPPVWIDEFDLRAVNLPPLNTDLSQTSLQKIGQQVTRQFQRYHIPFSPYNLRHAWAVRTIHFGLPDVIAAQMMGHSVNIHTKTYHRWISRRDQQQAVDQALRNSV